MRIVEGSKDKKIRIHIFNIETNGRIKKGSKSITLYDCQNIKVEDVYNLVLKTLKIYKKKVKEELL